MIGQTIAHYSITEKIGEGGMGEVYRAHDTKLNRDVALKILPQVFAQDSQRMARFEREAQVLASLNHSHIAQIHGLEETDGTKALVLELVEGETLAEQISRGPIPVDEALKIALQIAEGLEAAHEKGIIHRDLKPANIKITPEGEVKILDFGLAKALEGETPVSDLSHSPTITHAATEAGVILGTASYMSPEQARGKPVDKRTDIWAFGCVLYEMLTGKKAFEGDDVTEILASVIKEEPDFDLLPGELPRNVRRLLRRCLVKESASRLRDIGDFRLEIGEPFPQGEATEISKRKPVSVATLFGTMTIALLGWAVAGLLWLGSDAELREANVERFSIELTPEERVDTSLAYPTIKISRDGRRICWGGVSGGENAIYTRSIDSLEINRLPDTENAFEPVFSPDSEWIAFIRGSAIYRVSYEGGEVFKVFEMETGEGLVRSLSWLADGSIVFGGFGSDLFRLPAQGREPELFASIVPEKQEVFLHHPSLLPDDRSVLLSVAVGNMNDCHVELLSLETGHRHPLIPQAYGAWYINPGYLIFGREGQVWAVPFDLEALEITGPERFLVGGVQMDDYGRFAHASVAQNGTLVYAEGRQSERRLSWLSRDGEYEDLDVEPRLYSDPRLSPDGKQLAIMIGNYHERRLWIYDLERGLFEQLTFEGSVNRSPTWSPDGRLLAYQSNEGGQYNVFLKALKSEERSRRLAESAGIQVPHSWSPDGQTVAYLEIGESNQPDIYFASTTGQNPPVPFLTSPNLESNPRFSPNGQMLAYISDEDGTPHVYIKGIDQEVKRKVSRSGGASVVWAPDGTELYYVSLDGTRLFSVKVQSGGQSFGEEKILLDNLKLPIGASRSNVGEVWSFDIAPDGDRFLVLSEDTNTAKSTLVVVRNWTEELKRLVPTE